MAKPQIDLTPGEKPDSGHRNPRIKVVVRGEGTKDYVFPDVDELVRRGVRRVQKEGLKLRKPAEGGIGELTEDSKLPFKRMKFRDWFLPNRRWQSSEKQPPAGRSLVSGAEGLQGLMAARQFDAIVEERFGQLVGAVRWAKLKMGKKYLPSVLSLERQLAQLRTTYKQALPRLVAELGVANKGVPVTILLENSVNVLDQELAEILFVLRVYTDCFTQYRDGIYDRQLRAVNFMFEQAFLLFQTGDPIGCSDGKCAPRIETSAFQIGDVFVSRFTGLPLGTIPGSRGPIGAHALQVPFDLLDIVSIQFPLLAHEFRHNLFADIKGLEEEMTAAVGDALVLAHRKGEIKLGSDAVEVYHNRMPTIDLLVKMAADCMGEIDADIAGGVLLSGPAYLYNMLLSFPAMVQGPIAYSNQLLRSSSTYQMGGKRDGRMALQFAPHPPDYARAYFVAAALDEIDFKAQADECRALADYAVAKVPDAIVWQDARGKFPPIRILAGDVKAIAPFVARTLIRKPMKSLGGLSMGELVMWTHARQSKVEALVEQLLAGGTSVPADGDYYATYVGSAATMAYWRMVSGLHRKDAGLVAQQINGCALTMLDDLRQRYEQQ